VRWSEAGFQPQRALGLPESLTLTTERVDEMPLWRAQLERMGVQALRDAHFPTHGTWVGLSLGGVSVVWLPHSLSEADHRLNHVAPGAKHRLYTRKACTGQPVHPWDVRDDRLATVLEALRDDTPGSACEGARNQHARRVYALQPACVRLDRTTASGDGTGTADGLFPFGPSKDHRPDLPPVQVRLSALDPLGLPVATDVGPGQRADEPL
jgi:transposase